MSLHPVIRRAAPAFARAALALCVVAGPALAAGAAKQFCGGGRSLTPAGAIAAAIEDGANSASAEGLYTCELFGEPEVFERPDPRWGVVYFGQVTVSCTP